MKKFFYTFIFISLLVCFSLYPNNAVSAKEHTLHELIIHTYIHEDGSATITEVRRATLNEGTENFDIIENLGKSTIQNFTVTENGQRYEFIDNWNINASREEKAFKNGIIRTANGYELAWGIGDYGYHEYVLEYTVTDFIKQLDDSQILFWRFVNDDTNIPPEKLTIIIESEKDFNSEDEKIWGFGFNGGIYFKDGKVAAVSHQSLKSSDYATVLMKLSDSQFNTLDILSQTFEEIKREAFIGSDYEDNDTSTVSPSKKGTFSWLQVTIPLIVLSPLFIFLLVIFILWYRSYRRRKPRKKLKGEYEREIPYNGPFIDLYKLLIDIHVTKFENLIAAFLLKWMNEGLINIDEEDIGFIIPTKAPVIYIKEKEDKLDGLEGELYRMMLDAAGSDYKLKQSEFITWIESNRSRIRLWEKDVKKASQNVLTDINIFKEVWKRVFLFKRPTYELTTDGHDLEIRTYKFMNYLEDFSLLNEHEPINVMLWDELMIWASVLGITDEVYKQFRKLYPAYRNESSYSSTSISASSSLSRSISSSRSYVSSGGGGGSTSSGGGGGSFGGGSGGGTR